MWEEGGREFGSISIRKMHGRWTWLLGRVETFIYSSEMWSHINIGTDYLANGYPLCVCVYIYIYIPFDIYEVPFTV